MTAPAPVITAELRSLLRQVKLGRCWTPSPSASPWPAPATWATPSSSSWCCPTRSPAATPPPRSGAPAPPAWTPPCGWSTSTTTAKITYDRQVFDELCSLRFIDAGHNALIMGPVGVGKTFIATALGHAAVRRRHTVHFERADLLLKRLKASRLDNSHDAEMRKLLRVDLLILDDFCLQPMDAADTADIYELIVERHRTAATITTSNREPVEWLALMADPLLAQSAIDRLQSAAYELVLDGESYRRRQKPAISNPHGNADR